MNTIELSPTTPAASSAPGRRPFVRTGARIAITITAVAAAAIWLPRTLPSVDTLRSTFESAAWHWVLAAALLQFGSIGMLVRQQRRLLRALGTPIPLRRMAAITYSSTALAMSLPAGSAISAGYTFRQFRANGASTRTAGLALVLSGALSVGSLVLLFGVGWAVAFASDQDGPITAHPVTTMVLALAVGTLAIAGVRLVQRRRCTRTGSEPIPDRRPGPDGVGRHPTIGGIFRRIRDLVQDTRIVRAADWQFAMGTSAGKWLLDAACLYACTHAVGAQLAVWEIIGVYLGVQIVRQIPLTPGGIGLVEVALMTALMTAGVAAGPAAAATLVYRLLAAWVLIPVGFVILLVARRCAVHDWSPPAKSSPPKSPRAIRRGLLTPR